MWDRNIGKCREVFMEEEAFPLCLENLISIYQAVRQESGGARRGSGLARDEIKLVEGNES